MVCKVQSLQERQHHLGTWQKSASGKDTFMGHMPRSMKSETPGQGPAICSPASSPGDPEAQSNLRTTGLGPGLNLVLFWKEGDICHLSAKRPPCLPREPNPPMQCPHTRIQALDQGQESQVTRQGRGPVVGKDKQRGGEAATTHFLGTQKPRGGLGLPAIETGQLQDDDGDVTNNDNNCTNNVRSDRHVPVFGQGVRLPCGCLCF